MVGKEAVSEERIQMVKEEKVVSDWYKIKENYSICRKYKKNKKESVSSIVCMNGKEGGNVSK